MQLPDLDQPSDQSRVTVLLQKPADKSDNAEPQQQQQQQQQQAGEADELKGQPCPGEQFCYSALGLPVRLTFWGYTDKPSGSVDLPCKSNSPSCITAMLESGCRPADGLQHHKIPALCFPQLAAVRCWFGVTLIVFAINMGLTARRPC